MNSLVPCERIEPIEADVTLQVDAIVNAGSSSSSAAAWTTTFTAPPAPAGGFGNPSAARQSGSDHGGYHSAGWAEK
jgi:hypothetical protein